MLLQATSCLVQNEIFAQGGHGKTPLSWPSGPQAGLGGEVETLKTKYHLQAFYNSRGADGNASPLEFDTGVDAVPEAVDMCIRLMTPTEIASVTSVPKFAYQGRTDIPEVQPHQKEYVVPHFTASPPHILRQIWQVSVMYL